MAMPAASEPCAASSGAASEPASLRPKDKAEHARLSDVVRSMHVALEAAAATSPASDGSCSGAVAVEGWKAMWAAVDPAVAVVYADAMNKLFNVCWEGTTYVVDVIEGHFLGIAAAAVESRRNTKAASARPKRQRAEDTTYAAADGDASSSHGRADAPADGHAAATEMPRGICGRGLPFVKEGRRAYFAAHGQPMPASDVARLVAEGNRRFSRSPVRVVDVGSCHGGLLRHSPPWMQTLALDLQPACPAVLQADWLGLAIGDDELVEPPPPSAVAGTVAGGAPVPYGRVRALRVASFDVVVMCFMLSFLPTPPLRWEACRRASAVLADDGLLLILEPRRGAHSKRWHDTWSGQLPRLGFRLQRCQVMAKSVSLLFERVPRAEEASLPLDPAGAADEGLSF